MARPRKHPIKTSLPELPQSPVIQQDAPIEKSPKEKLFKIMIHKTEGDSGSTQVPVSVNGKTWLIKRGYEVEVPYSVVEVLNNAIKEVYEYDEKTSDINRKEVHSYPFSVLGNA